MEYVIGIEFEIFSKVSLQGFILRNHRYSNQIDILTINNPVKTPEISFDYNH